MVRSRWKLMAGVLGISIGGLAAVAGANATPKTAKRCPDPVQVGIPMIPTPVQGQVVQIPVLEAQVPTQLPTITSVSTPGEVIPTAFVAVSEVAPMPRSAAVQVLTLPVLSTSEPIFIAPVQAVVAAQPLPTPQAQPPLIAPLAPPVPAAPVPVQPLPTPPLSPSQPPLAELLPPPAPRATPSTEPQFPPMHEKKLKVMLHMGDERPRFEIRDGEETYLKVVCDKVDVKSPTERGDTTSTLKSTGKVAFVTPGGDGVCDELTVMPGSGMVVVSGKVTFRYTWGKAETTVSGDRMTFRLGNTPGQTSNPTIPASYTPRP